MNYKCTELAISKLKGVDCKLLTATFTRISRVEKVWQVLYTPQKRKFDHDF